MFTAEGKTINKNKVTTNSYFKWWRRLACKASRGRSWLPQLDIKVSPDSEKNEYSISLNPRLLNTSRLSKQLRHHKIQRVKHVLVLEMWYTCFGSHTAVMLSYKTQNIGTAVKQICY